MTRSSKLPSTSNLDDSKRRANGQDRARTRSPRRPAAADSSSSRTNRGSGGGATASRAQDAASEKLRRTRQEEGSSTKEQRIAASNDLAANRKSSRLLVGEDSRRSSDMSTDSRPPDLSVMEAPRSPSQLSGLSNITPKRSNHSRHFRNGLPNDGTT